MSCGGGQSLRPEGGLGPCLHRSAGHGGWRGRGVGAISAVRISCLCFSSPRFGSPQAPGLRMCCTGGGAGSRTFTGLPLSRCGAGPDRGWGHRHPQWVCPLTRHTIMHRIGRAERSVSVTGPDSAAVLRLWSADDDEGLTQDRRAMLWLQKGPRALSGAAFCPWITVCAGSKARPCCVCLGRRALRSVASPRLGSLRRRAPSSQARVCLTRPPPPTSAGVWDLGVGQLLCGNLVAQGLCHPSDSSTKHPACRGAGLLGLTPSHSLSPSPGTCVNFHSDGGGGGSPLDPLPPFPLSSSAAENLGFGNFFW